uniref:Uncharacterized protein n=1 Tax=Heterorhabditis bacteriophora TaxID=37862 RepID=A0A1I7WQW8_HETBA
MCDFIFDNVQESKIVIQINTYIIISFRS